MKKTAIVLAALVGIFGVSPAQAAEFKTVAVIDSGFDSSILGDSVIEEVCIVSISIGCNGAKNFDIGPGASGTEKTIMSRYQADWNHGTQMAGIIASVNPDVKLILIRDAKVLGSIVSAGNEKDFAKALSWVYDNTDKYNIVAVSFSRGSHTYATDSTLNRNKSLLRAYQNILDRLIKTNGKQVLIDIYTKRVADTQALIDSASAIPCKADPAVESQIHNLKTINVGTFIATGNDGDKNNIDTPACIDDAISVATLARYSNDDGTYNLANNTNVSTTTDFASNGEFNTVYGYERDSSSIATAVLAAYWAASYDGTFDGTYGILSSNSSTVAGYNVLAVDVLK